MEIDLTMEQIQNAVDQAVNLRRRTAINPDEVRSHALHPADAVRSTEGYRRNRRGDASLQWQQPESDPWWRVGWVMQEPVVSLDAPPSQTQFRQTWEVWLNVDDERVWLKLPRRKR
jgi:hypothetical protein